MTIKIKQFFLQVLISVTFLSLPYVFTPGDKFIVPDLINNAHDRVDFTIYLLMLIVFYFNYYVLVPHFYFTKKYFKYVAALAISFVIIAMVPEIFSPFDEPGPDFHNMVREILPNEFKPHKPFITWQLGQIFFIYLAGVFISMFLKINTRLKLTEEEKIRVELSYLKSQINPHFLFNTLNSIYALAIKENANNTATGMLKLSGMMRYVVTEASNELVSLEKEITYINNYIELQKLRLDKSVVLNFKINGDIQNQKIAPIILIPFIENAFKYGVNPDENSNINIVISISQLEIILLVENNIVTANSNTIEKSGYGIKNTKNRLALLYPSNYELDIQNTANFYTVKLKISLT